MSNCSQCGGAWDVYTECCVSCGMPRMLAATNVVRFDEHKMAQLRREIDEAIVAYGLQSTQANAALNRAVRYAEKHGRPFILAGPP